MQRINFLAENLKFLRTHSGLSQLALARRIGCQSSTINRIEDDTVRAQPRERTLLALAQLFNLSPEKLLNEKLTELPSGEQTQPLFEVGEPIPLIPKKGVYQKLLSGTDDAMSVEEAGEEIGTKTWLPPLPFGDSKKRTLVAYVMEGEALAPDIKDGDVLYVEGIFGEDPQPRSGQVVIAESDEKLYVRKLIRGDNDEQWLAATNPDWPGEKTLPCGRIYGAVVGLYRRF